MDGLVNRIETVSGNATHSSPTISADGVDRAMLDHIVVAIAPSVATKSLASKISTIDFDDTSSTSSSDANPGKVQLKSALSSPRSSMSSSGVARRGAWRAVGGAGAARSHAHSHKTGSELSPSSSSHGHDESCQISPALGSKPFFQNTHDDSESCSATTGAVHPAWDRFRQTGQTPPGTISYLPALGFASTANLNINSNSKEDGSNTRNKNRDGINDGFNANTNHSKNNQIDASSSQLMHPSQSLQDSIPSLIDQAGLATIPSGSYDWANFVFAYSRGRWNPGLTPQPPGQSTLYPGAKVKIKYSNDANQEAGGAGNGDSHLPSLEYSFPTSAEGTGGNQVLKATGLSIEPQSLLEPSWSGDQVLRSSNSTTLATGRSVESLPERSVSSDIAAPTHTDDALAEMYAALKETSSSTPAVTQFIELKNSGSSSDLLPQRASTAPEGFSSFSARNDDLPLPAKPSLLKPDHSVWQAPLVATPLAEVPLDDKPSLDLSSLDIKQNSQLEGNLFSSPKQSPTRSKPTPQKPSPSEDNQALRSVPQVCDDSRGKASSSMAHRSSSGGAHHQPSQVAIRGQGDEGSSPLARPGPTPVQPGGYTSHPTTWQSAPDGLSAFAEAMARQASGSAEESSGIYGMDMPAENGTVAGLRRAARKTSMERAERKFDKITRMDPSKSTLVSHSASFPSDTPRSSPSAHEVASLSHLNPRRNPEAASTRSESGTTVNVAHFVKGKPTGGTRIDLRTNLDNASSPPTTKSSSFTTDSDSLVASLPHHDQAIAALSRSRPQLHPTNSQKINAYLAAGRRAEMFYKKNGYLAAIIPPNEDLRLHALSRYGPPKIAGDSNFERIAHLVKLVFNSKVVLITLVGEDDQIFQTEMGGGSSVPTSSLQSLAGSRNCSFCSHAILQDGDEPIVVPDVSRDWRFAGNPLVKGAPEVRFYAGCPLRTSDGQNIGSLCLIDDRPRSEFGPRQRHTLKEFARVVMREMELLRDKIQLGMRDRMQRSIELFTKECLEMDSEENESESISSPQTTVGMHKVFHQAAESMREALQVSGAVIFDLSHFELIDSYESDFLPSDLGSTTSSKIYFSNPLEPSQHSDKLSPNHDRKKCSFDASAGIESVLSPILSPPADESAKGKSVPPMSVLGASEVGAVPPERNEPVPLIHHVKVAEFLRLHKTGKFYPFAPPPFRSLLPAGVTSLLLVPIFGLNKQPFALLCAYSTSAEKGPALEELQGSGLQYIRALGMIVLSAVLKKDIMLADKAKSNFISNISHELRTPLHGILAAAELLGETRLNSTQCSYLETVEACGKSLLELVNHVLDFTKLSGNTRQGQKQTHTKSKCDMVKLIQEVCESSWIGQMAKQLESAQSGIGSVYAPPPQSGDIASKRAKAKQAQKSLVETVIDITMRRDGWLVSCDTGGIRRVLMNLIGNSLKFTSQGFVHVSLREVQSSDTHLMVELGVTDTGRGISRTFLEEQLFHPFTQENPFGTGTGLGLSIVNSIVQAPAMNGKIDVWSTEGQGTEIRVTCELELCNEEDAEGPIYKPATNVQHEYSVSLLGFNDSRGDEDLRSALEGYFCDWWEFELVVQHEPGKEVNLGDIVLINDDLGILRYIQEHVAENLPPVVFLTCSRGDSDIAAACDAYHASGGVARILFKPAGPSKLEVVVDFCLQCLERRRDGDPPSTEETKPTTPLPSPSHSPAARSHMEQGDSYFASKPFQTRPDPRASAGHAAGSFESATSEHTVCGETFHADSQSISQLTPRPIQPATCQLTLQPLPEANVSSSKSYYMSPGPPTTSTSLIRRHSAEDKVARARIEASDGTAIFGSSTVNPTRPLLPARSITYHEPRLHKHVFMSPMSGPSPRREFEAESYFDRASTPSLPNSPGSTVSLEGGDGAVLKSAFAPIRTTSGSHKKRLQILSVEDNAINRKVIAAFLTKMDVDFAEASNGEEGVKQFEAHPPHHFDVIFMDLSMPVLDGIGAIAAIRKIEAERSSHADSKDSSNQASRANLDAKFGRPCGQSKGSQRHRSKIFALTGRSTDEDKRKAFQTGADGYIVKPLSFKVLSSLLRMLNR